MKEATFAEFEAAKDEIIHGKEYEGNSIMTDNITRKNYAVYDGTFYEVSTLRDDGTLETEFWSTKHSESRLYIQEPVRLLSTQADRVLDDDINRRSSSHAA